ncbi:hypothetical protein [Hyphomicrobium sp.]|uniref:hypothetical protein n=1 Tax=Hyphomicrobium sp. TaxID=82 RepID=UPI001D40D67D|nr:hypothetical protein [Hyphomicrobium sp.]MBY0560279.1 hypothetical protein [Hyphomicrobium sp.]
MNSRSIAVLLALGVVSVHGGAEACTLNEIQKADMRLGLCRQQVGIATGYACTTLVMRSQVADQFQQIDLARRCGFNAEAEKLQKFYNETTPLVAKLYECIDTAIDRPTVEKQAKEEVDKALSKLEPGCSSELKEKMAKRLPTLIQIDQKSLREMQTIASQIGLTPN